GREGERRAAERRLRQDGERQGSGEGADAEVRLRQLRAVIPATGPALARAEAGPDCVQRPLCFDLSPPFVPRSRWRAKRAASARTFLSGRAGPSWRYAPRGGAASGDPVLPKGSTAVGQSWIPAFRGNEQRSV